MVPAIPLRRSPRNIGDSPLLRYVSQHAETLNTEKALKAFLLPSVNHVYNEDGKKETLDSLLRGPKKKYS